MVNKLKIGLITCMLSSYVFADCQDHYKRHLSEQSTKALGMTALGISSVWISPLPLYIGYVIGTTGEPIAGISCAALGAGSIAGGGYTSGKGISLSSQTLSIYKVYRLINQAEAGFGSALVNLAEDLSEELDRDISEKQIAEIINLGNNSNDFCKDISKALFNKKELTEYIKEKL